MFLKCQYIFFITLKNNYRRNETDDKVSLTIIFHCSEARKKKVFKFNIFFCKEINKTFYNKAISYYIIMSYKQHFVFNIS